MERITHVGIQYKLRNFGRKTKCPRWKNNALKFDQCVFLSASGTVGGSPESPMVTFFDKMRSCINRTHKYHETHESYRVMITLPRQINQAALKQSSTAQIHFRPF